MNCAIKVYVRPADSIGMIAKAIPTVKNYDGESIVCACAWCYPGASLVAAFPQYAGMKVSHGMCKPHLAATYAEMDANAFKVAAVA